MAGSHVLPSISRTRADLREFLPCLIHHASVSCGDRDRGGNARKLGRKHFVYICPNIIVPCITEAECINKGTAMLNQHIDGFLCLL